eukprot:PhM_4_TR14616/c4_g1_i1/m.84433
MPHDTLLLSAIRHLSDMSTSHAHMLSELHPSRVVYSPHFLPHTSFTTSHSQRVVDTHVSLEACLKTHFLSHTPFASSHMPSWAHEVSGSTLHAFLHVVSVVSHMHSSLPSHDVASVYANTQRILHTALLTSHSHWGSAEHASVFCTSSQRLRHCWSGAFHLHRLSDRHVFSWWWLSHVYLHTSVASDDDFASHSQRVSDVHGVADWCRSHSFLHALPVQSHVSSRSHAERSRCSHARMHCAGDVSVEYSHKGSFVQAVDDVVYLQWLRQRVAFASHMQWLSRPHVISSVCSNGHWRSQWGSSWWHTWAPPHTASSHDAFAPVRRRSVSFDQPLMSTSIFSAASVTLHERCTDLTTLFVASSTSNVTPSSFEGDKPRPRAHDAHESSSETLAVNLEAFVGSRTLMVYETSPLWFFDGSARSPDKVPAPAATPSVPSDVSSASLWWSMEHTVVSWRHTHVSFSVAQVVLSLKLWHSRWHTFVSVFHTQRASRTHPSLSVGLSYSDSHESTHAAGDAVAFHSHR